MCDEWAEGSMTEPLARIKVDEKNCFGMIEWKAVRGALFSSHAHCGGGVETSKLQDGVAPMSKDRGAEQGEVDGPLECSPALGMVASETRGSVAAHLCQAAFLGVVLMIPQKYSTCKKNTQPNCREFPTFITGADDPRHALQKMEAWRTCGTWTTVTSCVT